MKFNLHNKLLELRMKGFVIYVLAIFLTMMLLLGLIDLAVDLLMLDSFVLQRFFFQDFPINLFMSFLVALSGWFFYGKPLKLKSDIIEINLNNKNGKKEK